MCMIRDQQYLANWPSTRLLGKQEFGFEASTNTSGADNTAEYTVSAKVLGSSMLTNT